MSRRMRRSTLAVLAAGLVLVGTAFFAHADVGIEARIAQKTLAVGETTTLEVVVSGASGSIAEPSFTTPPGLEILGTGRENNFSWVNGRSTVSTIFRYEISPNQAGRFTLGPIDVRVGNQVYRSGSVAIVATAAPVRVGGGGGATPATLLVEVLPKDPYVGQPVTMRVRLIQRARLAEEPDYVPPTTAGFWTDKPSPPESYYAAQGDQRVLVTETRTRLYPLTPGVTTIGSATASLMVIEGGDPDDPFSLLMGRARRPVIAKS